MADMLSLEEMLNPFQATQNRLKRALAQAQGMPAPQESMVDQIPGMQPRGMPPGLADQIPGMQPRAPQPTPMVQPPQRPPGRVINKSVAATSTTGALPTNPADFTSADQKTPQIPSNDESKYWGDYDRQMAELQQTLNVPQDYSGYENVAKQRGTVAGNNLMLALLMNQTTGFEDTGKHLLRQALAAQGPQEFDEGMVDVSGKFVERPGLKMARELRAKEFMLTAAEKRAMREMTADEKRATLAAAEARWKAEMLQRERHQQQQLGATYAGQNKLQFHKGDDGQVYTFNPVSGEVKVADVAGAGAAIGGPTRLPSKASADDKKRWTEATLGMEHAGRMLKQIEGLSKGEQADIGGVRPALNAVMRSATQGAFGVPDVMMPGNEKTRALQTDLARDAAMMVNQLYGAAVSKMEGARGTPFLVQQGDDVATVQRKLRAAMDYARGDLSTLARQYGLPPPAGVPAGGVAPGQKTAADYLGQVK